MYEERKSNCSTRIADALSMRNMKQSELSEKTKIPKSAISQYISGAFEPKQDRIYLIAQALDVSEAWLMGYDIPMERDRKTSPEERTLTEGEKKWLELYNKVSDETKDVLINMLDSFDRLPAESQRMALEMIRVALRNQKQ